MLRRRRRRSSSGVRHEFRRVAFRHSILRRTIHIASTKLSSRFCWWSGGVANRTRGIEMEPGSDRGVQGRWVQIFDTPSLLTAMRSTHASRAVHSGTPSRARERRPHPARARRNSAPRQRAAVSRLRCAHSIARCTIVVRAAVRPSSRCWSVLFALVRWNVDVFSRDAAQPRLRVLRLRTPCEVHGPGTPRIDTRLRITWCSCHVLLLETRDLTVRASQLNQTTAMVPNPIATNAA